MPPPLPRDDLHAGDLIADRYRLGSLLGTGGMADVWDATDERLHRTVALKVLRDDPAAPPEDADAARRRFRDEGRMAARQSHRSIVAVYDSGEADGRAYLVMERLSGETLRDRLQAGGLGDDEVRLMMADVLAALGAAHQAGIAHRDIKPSNVLRGADGRWKVADFGIAKPLDETVTGDHTQVGLVVGTPRFIAPERLAGRPATPASDIYSAGVLLREALGGRADADPALLAAATRATAADPAGRFASARSMADAVTSAQGAATAAISIEGIDPLDATVVDGVATAPVAATIATSGPATAVLPPASAPPRRRSALLAAAAIAALVVIGGLTAAAMSGGGGSDDPQTGPTAVSTTEAPEQSADPTTTAPPATTTAVATTAAATTTTTAPAEPTPTEPAPKDPKDPKGKDNGKGKP